MWKSFCRTHACSGCTFMFSLGLQRASFWALALSKQATEDQCQVQLCRRTRRKPFRNCHLAGQNSGAGYQDLVRLRNLAKDNESGVPEFGWSYDSTVHERLQAKPACKARLRWVRVGCKISVHECKSIANEDHLDWPVKEWKAGCCISGQHNNHQLSSLASTDSQCAVGLPQMV